MSSDTDVVRLAEAVLAGDRTAVARAITLVESTLVGDRRNSRSLLARLLPHAGHALRVGITGVPGAGKSTLIDAVGTRLTASSHRVGVLAVDPSSAVTGGAILGDKTRMTRLAGEENAFVRPSSSAGFARRRHERHASGHHRVGGRRIRRGARRDDGCRPVRVSGARLGRLRVPVDAGGCRRRASGHEARFAGARRRVGREQSRRRQRATGAPRRGRIAPGAAAARTHERGRPAAP